MNRFVELSENPKERAYRSSLSVTDGARISMCGDCGGRVWGKGERSRQMVSKFIQFKRGLRIYSESRGIFRWPRVKIDLSSHLKCVRVCGGAREKLFQSSIPIGY